MTAHLFSDELLHVAAVRTADDELRARSEMFQLVTDLDLLAAEVAVDQAIGAVVGQVLVEKAAFELGAAAVAARYRIELALLRVTLTRRQEKNGVNIINSDSTGSICCGSIVV